MELLNEALKQGVAPAAVVAVYLIITKLIDGKKEKAQTKLNSELIKSINNISEFLTNITKDIINKERDKCRAAIDDALHASGMRLVNFVSATIINNHIDINKETILSNIKNIINTEYYSIYSTLSLYKINGVIASDHLKQEWIDMIERDMVDIVYNTDLNKDDKILSFSNKLTLKFQSYITYLTNNVIK